MRHAYAILCGPFLLISMSYNVDSAKNFAVLQTDSSHLMSEKSDSSTAIGVYRLILKSIAHKTIYS